MSASQPQPQNTPPLRESILQRVRRVSASVPKTEWEKLPKDLAKNYKHYLYGHSKKDE